jgi:hypothetical protein
MATEWRLSEVLQKFHEAKKTGVLYISITAQSENLIRFYFMDGRIKHFLFGASTGDECLDLLDCYDFNKAYFFEGVKAPEISNLTQTENIIDRIKGKDPKIGLINTFWADEAHGD